MASPLSMSEARQWATSTTGEKFQRKFKLFLNTQLIEFSHRIWAAIKREALLAASEGAATPREIDAIFRGVLNTPKGPFELMDVVGLDVVLDIEQHYADARGNLPAEPREYLKKYLDRGDLGVKSGKGFYDYTGNNPPTPPSS